MWWGLYNLQTFFGLYKLIVNTSKWVLSLPPSDAYVRSFLYHLYTLIKLYYTHTKKKIKGKTRTQSKVGKRIERLEFSYMAGRKKLSVFLSHTHTHTAQRPSNPTQRYLSKGNENTCLQKPLYTIVLYNFIYKPKNLFNDPHPSVLQHAFPWINSDECQFRFPFKYWNQYKM